MSERIADPYRFGSELARILGIERCIDIDLSVHLTEAPRATVTFIINEIQAQAIVEMLDGTKWGQPK